MSLFSDTSESNLTPTASINGTLLHQTRKVTGAVGVNTNGTENLMRSSRSLSVYQNCHDRERTYD